MSEVIPFTIRAERAWQAYVEAAARAQQSQSLSDGILAGKAWRRFLDTFVSPEQRQTLGHSEPLCR